MNDTTLAERLEAIEAGYEFCLAYAALDGLAPLLEGAVLRDGARHAASTRVFLDAVKRDLSVAQGAIGMVLDSGAIGSLLIDNLNASIHLRALLTDLFLLDQARK